MSPKSLRDLTSKEFEALEKKSQEFVDSVPKSLRSGKTPAEVFQEIDALVETGQLHPNAAMEAETIASMALEASKPANTMTDAELDAARIRLDPFEGTSKNAGFS